MTTLITNVSVVDVETGESHAGQNIEIENGQIVAVSHASSPRKTFDEVIDASGQFACPGLIDSHVHLFLDGGADPRNTFLRATDEELLTTAKANAALAISSGVTTVRDCGGPADLVFRLQRMVESGYIVSPRILAAGAPLTRPGGHCHFFGIEVTERAQVFRAVDAQARQGASFVKVIASGGGLTPGTDPAEADLPLPLIQAAVEAARANGIQVAAHCHAVESIARALDAGVQIIEHSTFARLDGPPAFIPDMAKRMRDQGTVVSPTATSGIRIAQAIRKNGTPNATDSHAIERLEARRDHVARFSELGVRLVAGTDCGVTNVPFDSLISELREYVGVGMSCAQALRSATSESAQCLGQPRLGQVKQGFAADLLLLGRNPLRTIDALSRPLVVWKAGQIVHNRRPAAAYARS
jgi:imidazolonepropionase-like amidohydrolase